jgi:hypothetical protein
MAELVTIYCTLPDDVSKTVQLLESHGFHPVVVDDVDKMGGYRSHEIRIAVPAPERDRAVAVLTEADRQGKARIAHLVKGTDGIVLIMMAALGFVALIGMFDTHGTWFFALWAILITAAAVVLIRWAWRKKDKD